MFEAAETREVDVLLFCWSLDRFSREGIRKTTHYLQQLRATQGNGCSKAEMKRRTGLA